MRTFTVTVGLMLLAAQSSFAQVKAPVDQRLLQYVESRLQETDKSARKFAEIADSANHAFMACVGIESFAVGALTGGASLAGEVGAATAATASAGWGVTAWTASAGGMGAMILPAATFFADSAAHSFKDVPMRTHDWAAPLVERINASHRGEVPLTLKLINQNMDRLRDERMKILSTSLNGSFKSGLKDRLTCGYLSQIATGKLAEISATEYQYLHAVYLSLTKGYPVEFQSFVHNQGSSYRDVMDDLARFIRRDLSEN